MSSSDSVVTATENASRLGHKHVCVSYFHVASHDYQEVIQHTRDTSHLFNFKTHKDHFTNSPTKVERRFFFFFFLKGSVTRCTLIEGLVSTLLPPPSSVRPGHDNKLLGTTANLN